MIDPGYIILNSEIVEKDKPSRKKSEGDGNFLDELDTSKKRNEYIINYFDRNIAALKDGKDSPIRVMNLDVEGEKINNFYYATKDIDELYWADEHICDVSDNLNNSSNLTTLSTVGRKFLAICTHKSFESLKKHYYELIINNQSIYKFRSLKNIFKQIVSIDNWNDINRTSYLKKFLNRKDLEGNHENDDLLLQLDLFYYNSNSEGYKFCLNQLKNTQVEAKFQIVNEYRNDDIETENVIIKIDRNNINYFVTYLKSNSNNSLFNNELVRYIRELDDIDIEVEGDCTDLNISIQKPKYNEANVAVIDCKPDIEHNALNDYLIIGRPNEYEKYNIQKHKQHGNNMVSLIAHNDINYRNRTSIDFKVYSYPFHVKAEQKSMEERFKEAIDNILGYYNEIKIINISLGLGDYDYNYLSDVAKLLDQYAWEERVLFNISMGNVKGIPLLECLETENPIKHLLSYTIKITESKRLTKPAESVNSLAIGAFRNVDFIPSNNLFGDKLIINFKYPAEYSRVGLGFNSQIKPDILVHGGNLIYKQSFNKFVLYKTINHKVATYVNQDPDGYECTKGTSNATAITSHYASKFFDSFDNYKKDINKEHYSVLTKALLVHSADCTELYSIFVKDFNLKKDEEKIAKHIGYGVSNFDNLIKRKDTKSLYIGCNNIMNKEIVHKIRIPAKRKVEITITLAWFTPYFKKRVIEGRVILTYIISDKLVKTCYSSSIVKKGTVQHERFIINNVNEAEYFEIITVKCVKNPSWKFAKKIPYAICVTTRIIEDYFELGI